MLWQASEQKLLHRLSLFYSNRRPDDAAFLEELEKENPNYKFMGDPNGATNGFEMIKLKRAYDKPAKDDGERILVERLWPRGLTKEQAKLDLWLKDVAPSTELRKWFGHDPDRWIEFRQRYLKELRQNADLIKLLKRKAKEGTITLIYAARDEEHNGALVLKQFLQRG
jgi:uncharacterized protein YeaO (DUF488 family)